jgi:putative aldouronate transport system substrate-binding protein
MTNPGFPEGDTLESNEWLKYIRNRINVDVKFDWIVASGDPFNQKVALVLASGQMPDTLIVDRRTFKQLAESDMIVELTQIYQDTASPYMKECYDSFDGRCIAEATIDGKMMALPKANIGGAQDMLWVRQDWLDKLDLQMPKTLEDIKAVAKAFIEQDPDGNNAADTVGLTLDARVTGYDNASHMLSLVFGLYGAYPRQWIKDAKGNVIYGSTTPETKAALAEINNMYKAGLIDREFAIRGNDVNTLVASGKVGLMFGPWWAAYWPLADSVKNDPKADWKPTIAPVDAAGNVHSFASDPSDPFLVISKNCKNPEAIIKVLNVELDAVRQLDPEAANIPYFNQEGLLSVEPGTIPINLIIDKYTVIDSIFKSLQDAIDKGNNNDMTPDTKSFYVSYMKNLNNPGADSALWGEATARYNGQRLCFDPRVKLSSPVFFGTTPTMDTKWVALKKMEDEMLLKIIMGEEPIDSFDKFVTDWNNLGGNQITEEVKKVAAGK